MLTYADIWRTQVLDAHTSTVWCFAFDASGERMATGSDDSTIRFWRDSSLSSPTKVSARESQSDTGTEAQRRSGIEAQSSLSVGVSLSLYEGLYRPPSLSRARSLSCTLAPSLPLARSLALSLARALSRSRSLALSLFLSLAL